MRRQQLYINGKAVDMPAEEIKIKVESNLFADFGNLKTAHSYSITLPRTMTNDSILMLAYVAGADTGGKSTHRYLKAALYLDGVPLFVDGRCVVEQVGSNGYQCNLYWGLLGIFDEIKDEGLDLCDLPMSSRWDEDTMAGEWVKIAKYMGAQDNVTGMSNDIYNTLDPESKTRADTMPWTMPSVPATSILDKIAQVYGVTINTSSTARSRIAQLYHPLVTLKAMAEDEVCKIRLASVTIHPDSHYYPIILAPRIDASGMYSYGTWTEIVPATATSQATSQPIANDVLRFGNNDGSVYAVAKLAIKSIHVYGTCDKYFEAACYVEDDPSNVVVPSQLRNGVYTIDHTWEDLSAEADDSLIAIGAGSGAYWTSMPSSLNVKFDLVVEKIEDLKVGNWWNAVRNYPEMGVIDYLNEILAHIGGCIVGSVADADTLTISTFDEVVQATSESIDTLGVKSISMALDDLAQKNIYTHKDNEDTGINYTGEGVLRTSDTTLERERKAFESKFKVPRLALIRLWEVEKNDGESTYKATWEADGDYICGNNGTIDINTGQDFERTLANYYAYYGMLINYPKVVEAVVKLNALALRDFDFSHPFYIPQIGRSYLIKSLESEQGEKYKLTMVQI